MSIFSETYQKIIGDRKVRVYEMAEFLEIAPQTLYQILGGRRKPADEEFTRKLASWLGLSVAQTDRLVDASERTRLGEEVYWQRRICRKFLLTSVSANLSYDLLKLSVSEERFAKVQVLSSTAQITEAIALIAKNDQKNPSLRIFSGFTDSVLNTLTRSLAISRPDLQIIQAGYIPSSLTDEDEIGAYFDALQSVITMYFCSSGYSAYLLPESQESQPAPFSRFALSASGIVLFQEDLSQGLLIRDADAAKCYCECFDGWLKNQQPLFMRSRSLLGLILYFGEMQELLGRHLDLWTRQGCFAPVMDERLIAKYLRPEVAGQPDFSQLGSLESVIAFFSAYAKNSGQIWEHNEGVMYFPEDGIRSLLETGIVQEFPVSCWKVMDMEDRLILARRFIDGMHKYPFKMMKGYMGDQQDGFSVCSALRSGYIQLRQPDGEICILTMQNPRLSAILCDYMKSIPERECYTTEEAIKRLSAMCDEFEEKMRLQKAAEGAKSVE